MYDVAFNRLLVLYDKNEASTISWWLLEALTGHTRLQLMSFEYPWTEEQKTLLALWLDDHIIRHKPLAYIIGWVPFCGLRIMVKPPLLIPRPETEEWVSNYIEALRAQDSEEFSLLDMCTGTGCIALAIAHAFPKAHIYALDIDPRALSCAQENARFNDIANVTYLESDLFKNIVNQQFDFIVSNPPYIAHDEADLLAPSVRDWENPQALFADDEGYALIKDIIKQAPLYMKSLQHTPNSMVPRLCIEIGYRQGPLTLAYMKEHGYYDVHSIKDYAGHDRIVCGSYDVQRVSTYHE